MKSHIQCTVVGAWLVLSSLATAQDVDVPNNLTMRNSSDGTTGNVLKDGVPFIHNFGTNNTFLGSNAGNLTMESFGNNTAIGSSALFNNTTGTENAPSGSRALGSNTRGDYNTANGASALGSNTTGSHTLGGKGFPAKREIA